MYTKKALSRVDPPTIDTEFSIVTRQPWEVAIIEYLSAKTRLNTFINYSWCIPELYYLQAGITKSTLSSSPDSPQAQANICKETGQRHVCIKSPKQKRRVNQAVLHKSCYFDKKFTTEEDNSNSVWTTKDIQQHAKKSMVSTHTRHLTTEIS